MERYFSYSSVPMSRRLRESRGECHLERVGPELDEGEGIVIVVLEVWEWILEIFGGKVELKQRVDFVDIEEGGTAQLISRINVLMTGQRIEQNRS